VEGEPAARGSGVDLLGQRPKPDLAPLERPDNFDQVPQPRPRRSSRQTTSVSPSRM
jgi:hypothetical protein